MSLKYKVYLNIIINLNYILVKIIYLFIRNFNGSWNNGTCFIKINSSLFMT